MLMIRDFVATKLKARRFALGLSLGEAALRCGLSKSHLSKLEDDCNPSVETLLALASGYDCEARDFLPTRAERDAMTGLPRSITPHPVRPHTPGWRSAR